LTTSVQRLRNSKTGASKATKTAVLLLDGLLQHLGSELRQRSLDVSTSQATSGRGTLKQRLLALLNLSLEACATFDVCDGLTLCLGAKQASDGLLLLECLLTSLLKWLQLANSTSACRHIGFEQFLNCFKLPPLLCNASLRGSGLRGCCALCGIGLRHARNKGCATNGNACQRCSR
jgi:hypothetical protein